MDNHKFSRLHIMMIHNSDIVIIGSGLNGLTLSLVLGTTRLKVALVEGNTLAKGSSINKKFDGRAYALTIASQRLLKAINIWPSLKENAQPILDIKVTDGHPGIGSSPFLMHFNHSEIGDDPIAYMVEDRHLKREINNCINASNNIKRFSGNVVNNKLENNKNQVFLEDGSIINTKVILACDGRGSPTAKRAGISFKNKNYQQQALVTAVKHEKNHNGIAHQFFMPLGPLAILPLTKNNSSIVWVLSKEIGGQTSKLNNNAFLEKLRPAFGSFLGDIKVSGERFSYPLNLITADSFTGERLALVGDAAHSIHPLAGQGFNQGIRDIATIAEVLVDAYRRGEDIGTKNVLDRYSAWRRFDSKSLGSSTDFFNTLFSNDNTYLRVGRNLGMGLINSTTLLKQFLIREATGLNGDQPRLLQGVSL